MSSTRPSPKASTSVSTWLAPVLGNAEQGSLAHPALSEEKLSQIHQAAYDKGFLLGEAAGQTAGAAAMQQATAAVTSAVTLLETPVQQLQADVLAGITQLAGAIATRLVQRELELDATLLETWIQEAAADMPKTTQGTTITLNPADARLLRQHLNSVEPAPDWLIGEDSGHKPGTATLQTQQAQVEVSITTMVEQVLEHLQNVTTA